MSDDSQLAALARSSEPGPPASCTQMPYASVTRESALVTPTTLSSQPIGCRS